MISLVIPTYNRGKVLESTVEAVHEMLRELGQPFEIIVVFDGQSPDDSYARIVRLQKTLPELTYYAYQQNTGKGAAVTVGFSKAQGDYIGFLDDDNSVSLDTWREMINFIMANGDYDSVIASRYRDLTKVKQSALRKVSGKMFNLVVRLMFGLKLADTQCGGKLFTRRAVDLILKNTTIKGFSFDIEYLSIVHKHGLKIKEIQTYWESAPRSVFKNMLTIVVVGLPMLIDLFKFKFNKQPHYTWKDILY